MEPFEEIPRCKWPELKELYRKDWPVHAAAYCLLDTQISYPNLANFYNFKVYSPGGDIAHGFVAVFFEKETAHEMMINPLKSIDKLEKALTQTKIINWDKIEQIICASPVVEECMRRLEKPLGLKTRTEENKALKHLLDRSSKQFKISNNPPNTYVAELKSEHLDIIDKAWTFHSPRSYKLFQSLLEYQLINVLYSSIGNTPLAWVTVSWEGSLTHLYRMEEHRRKGYSEYIVKVAANDQLSKGKDVLGCTLENNTKAQNLFDKLNFKRTGSDTWIEIVKK